MKDKKYRLGIDLGGTNIKAGVLTQDGKLIATMSMPTNSTRGWQAVVEDMAKTAKLAAEKASVSLEECCGCGVGCPGTIDQNNGVVIYSNNLDWENVPLAEKLNQLLGLKIKITNDANCAALGECVSGAAKGKQSAVLITLGTGVGGGIIMDGKLFEGGVGAIELGHIQLVDEGELCTCGRKGCFESYASATALIRIATQSARNNPNSLLYTNWQTNNAEMNGRIPFDAAQNGDETAKKVIEQYINYLGKGITDLVNIFRPEVVLLSGGICAQGEVLTVPLQKYVQEHTFASAQLPAPEIKIATLGNDAGIVGAANLVQ